ncbi:MAG TPA: DUF6629 family protein [Xanthobacteraceae bacterium]|nr:DUF6629 family protein [Xanthobacteraceae bacterium]
MCFSASASFITAGLTGVVGVISVGKAKEQRELPLAMTPLVFAFQQSIEGLLWLNIPLNAEGWVSTSLSFLFVFFAESFWPVYAPIAALLIESDKRRRRLMLLCLLVGITVSAYLLWSLLIRVHGATIATGHIVYLSDYQRSDAVGLAYITATVVPLLISSQRTVVTLGAVILVGSIVAYALYWDAFVSVWCFLAAAASILILYHFERSRRMRLGIART